MTGARANDGPDPDPDRDRITEPDSDTVFLLDVDNTLLDTDQFLTELRQHVDDDLGAAGARRYWSIFETLRGELGYADYLGALQRYRCAVEFAQCGDPRLLHLSSFLLDYPFAARLFPDALEVVGHLNRHGRAVILSDGDMVYQPLKIRRSGLWDAVSGRVLIYIHKEQMLDAVQRHYPARHYVMVDDKPRILTAMKRAMQTRLTTVFARQGHYALEGVPSGAHQMTYPPADLSVDRIGALLDVDPKVLRGDPDAVLAIPVIPVIPAVSAVPATSQST